MKSTNLLSRTCIAMVLMTLATTTAIAQTQAIHTLKMTDGTVNQNYNTDALIDMQSTSKGLLLPRVELTGTTAAAPLAAHTAGMVVYNTVSAGSGGTAVSPGYYYNDGTQWVKIGSAAAISAWGQYGNTGTTPAANWIGTNDVADFVTKTNGAERLRVTSGGKLLVGTATSLTGGDNAIMQINNGTTNGALQIVDGTQGAGKVLTSDANGLATWTDGSGIAWTLKGNSGITANNAAYGSSLSAATGNWLGTINSADLILAANNKEGLRVNSSQQVLIGTTTVPTGGTNAKVIIDNGTTAGALQIKDGTEGDGKIFFSDDDGVGTWQKVNVQNLIEAAGFVTAGASYPITTTKVTFNKRYGNMNTNSTWIAPKAGNYYVTFSWSGDADADSAPKSQYWISYRINGGSWIEAFRANVLGGGTGATYAFLITTSTSGDSVEFGLGSTCTISTNNCSYSLLIYAL
jgi:hypothetical protein